MTAVLHVLTAQVCCNREIVEESKAARIEREVL